MTLEGTGRLSALFLILGRSYFRTKCFLQKHSTLQVGKCEFGGEVGLCLVPFYCMLLFLL